MLGRPVALPFAAQLFTGVTYVNFSTSSLPSLRRLAVHKVGWLGVRPLGSSLSLRRLAAHHVGPARGVAPRRTVIRRLYRRVALRHRPRCPVDGWPPTIGLAWGSALDAQLLTGVTGRADRHSDRHLDDLPPRHFSAWAGSLRQFGAARAVASGLTLRYRPHRLFDSWPPTMLGWPRDQPLETQLLADGMGE